MFYLTPWTRERTNGSTATVHPLEMFGRFNETLDRFFGRENAAEPARGQAWGSSLRELEKEVLASFDAPGFEPGEFDIQINEETVSVSAEHRVKDGEQEFVERSFGRSFTLPCAVDFDRVEAKYRNGVLELRFPKVEPPQARKIVVQNA